MTDAREIELLRQEFENKFPTPDRRFVTFSYENGNGYYTAYECFSTQVMLQNARWSAWLAAKESQLAALAAKDAEIERLKQYEAAIVDHMVITHVSIGNNPRENLDAVINWYIQVECDPQVSGSYAARQIEQLQAELKGAKDACRLALNAFEKNHAIDWCEVEKHASDDLINHPGG